MDAVHSKTLFTIRSFDFMLVGFFKKHRHIHQDPHAMTRMRNTTGESLFALLGTVSASMSSKEKMGRTLLLVPEKEKKKV
jgi:hypothetical protein